MLYGLNVINAWPPAFIVELATLADAAGWDGVFLWDHLPFEFDVPLHDPWVLRGALARTERVRLGPLVTPLARRRPHQVAKEAVTLDHLSNGRAVLGIGLGGVEREFAAFGETRNPRGRAEKLDEACTLIARYRSMARRKGGGGEDLPDECQQDQPVHPCGSTEFCPEDPEKCVFYRGGLR